MENRTKALALLFCLTTLPAQARLRNPFSKSQVPSSEAQHSGDIPFRLVHSSLVLATGSLNGMKGRNLLIDTGTNPTVLDVETARKLGIMGRADGLRTLGGAVEGTKGVLASLTLGPVKAESVPVFVADLSFINREVGERVDAVVGLDVLGARSFTIDYEKQSITVGRLPAYRYWVPFRGGPPMITVDMQINGQPKRLLVDTGAEGLFVFESPKQENGQATLASRNRSNISLTRNREQVEIREVRLGSIRRTKQQAYVVHLEQALSRDFDGLLGLRALGIKEVVFDFERGRLGWR